VSVRNGSALQTVVPFSLFTVERVRPCATEWFDSVVADGCPRLCQIMRAR
jgi:hypothetical protein